MDGMKDFVSSYATKRGIPKSTAQQEVNAFLETLKESVKNNGGVSFKGIFTMKKVLKKGRSGKCNGIEYTTEDKNTVKLSVGSSFEEELN